MTSTRQTDSTTAAVIKYHQTGDQSIRRNAILQYMPLVRSIAWTYVGCGEPIDDLIQVGTIGLIDAVDQFDILRNAQFSTFAQLRIRGPILHYLRDKRGTIKIPAWLKDWYRKYRQTQTSLANDLGRMPYDFEIATALGLDEQKMYRRVNQYEQISQPLSLNARLGKSDGTEYVDLLPTCDQGLDHILDKDELETMLGILQPKQRQVLSQIFLDGCEIAEIAAAMNCSTTYVYTVKMSALSSLRRRFA
jgi:RNA polymerase sigma-B factor